jgi:predicted N-acetyltransferase YhbS
LTVRPYQAEDFIPIRDFLVRTYAHFQRSYNWTIERWNFSVSVARVMHDTSYEDWASQIGVWEDDGAIVAVVNAEGEADGEAFFQLAHEHLPDPLLRELFDFCEARLGKAVESGRVIQLFVPAGDTRLEALAQGRGFERQDWQDHDAILNLDAPKSVSLPAGYTFADGRGFTPQEKGIAHAKAFGYYGEPVYPERAVDAFRQMTQTPDYRADLDLCVRAPDGEVASFATMWYDAGNRIGILEPVGTIPAHRKQGLGRAAIFEAVNRILSEGATKVHVGSNQVFYQRLGFIPRAKYTVWRKVMPASREGT